MGGRGWLAAACSWTGLSCIGEERGEGLDGEIFVSGSLTASMRLSTERERLVYSPKPAGYCHEAPPACHLRRGTRQIHPHYQTRLEVRRAVLASARGLTVSDGVLLIGHNCLKCERAKATDKKV